MIFDQNSTTDEVLAGIRLDGRTALVTGANTGLGTETARALAAAGARVIMTARNAERGAAALAQVRAQVPGAEVELVDLDLTSLASVRACAQAVLARHDRLHLLINNAGVMATPFERTRDGFELQMGTNHLGHFLLAGLLAPALLRAAPARVVAVSSLGHYWSDIRWDDPNWERTPYDKWQAYGQSKTANILFAVELDRRLWERGVNAFSLHPGAIHTELGRYMTPEDLANVAKMAEQGATQWKTVPQGAASSVWAATAPGLVTQGGAYIQDCQVQRVGDFNSRVGHAPWARDLQSAARLWELSERMVGQAFPLD
ncbi:MAG: oxidoreductase [Gammaproteobacteria bacterium]